jgi:membrane-associated phospholipid phosphatase
VSLGLSDTDLRHLRFEKVKQMFRRYFDQANATGLEPALVRRALLLSVLPLILLAVMIPVFVLCGFVLNWAVFATIGLVGLAAVALSTYCFYRARSAVVGHAVASFAQMSLLNATLLGWTYAAAATGAPLQDNLFAAMDAALGFNWMAWKDVIVSDSRILYVTSRLYEFLEDQAICVGLLSVIFLRFTVFHRFMVAWILTLAVVISCSAFIPAFAAFYHYGVVEEMRQIMSIASGYIHIEQLEQVRAGTPFDPYHSPVGIIAFPSFHAAGAVLFAYFFWHFPLLRWPMLFLNLGMILITPIIGSHYFVDIIAGVIVAGLAIAVSHRLIRPESEA